MKQTVNKEAITKFDDHLHQTFGLQGGGSSQDSETLKGIIEGSATKIIIPEGTTSIGDYAFYYNETVEQIIVPSTVTEIGSYSFSECKNLTSVNIPEGVTKILSHAFSNCKNLTSVNIPSSVTEVESNVFFQCSHLTKAEFASIESICSIEFDYSNPLFYAHHLYINGEEVTELIIPDNVTSIGNYAFNGCTGLTSVTIHENVTSIGNNAFAQCGPITVTCLATTPPTLGSNVFSNNYGAFVIYVPAESVDTYKAASGWSNYSSYIQAIPTT